MYFLDAIAKVRSGTLHDVDTQFTDDQLLAELYNEYRRQRRWLCANVPSLCENVVSGILATVESPEIDKSYLDNFERLVLFEKMASDGTYYPVDVSSGFNRSNPTRLSVREMPTKFVLSPTSSAEGAYQVTFLVGSSPIDDNEDLIDLPGGLEDVVVERGCAWVRQRHNEDWQYHAKRADTIQAEAYSQLRHRYGSHSVSGLKRERAR